MTTCPMEDCGDPEQSGINIYNAYGCTPTSLAAMIGSLSTDLPSFLREHTIFKNEAQIRPEQIRATSSVMLPYLILKRTSINIEGIKISKETHAL